MAKFVRTCVMCASLACCVLAGRDTPSDGGSADDFSLKLGMKPVEWVKMRAEAGSRIVESDNGTAFEEFEDGAVSALYSDGTMTMQFPGPDGATIVDFPNGTRLFASGAGNYAHVELADGTVGETFDAVPAKMADWVAKGHAHRRLAAVESSGWGAQKICGNYVGCVKVAVVGCDRRRCRRRYLHHQWVLPTLFGPVR